MLLSVALAHTPGISYARVEPDELTLTFARPELATISPELEPGALRAATLEQVDVSAAGEACRVIPGHITAVESDGIDLTAELDCPPGERTFTARFFPILTAGHRVFVEHEGEPAGVLDASSPSTGLGSPGWLAVAGRFLGLGVEHIWTGYDHLAFLVGLLLVARGLREMLLIVTGFTVAHSITLTLGATGVATLPPSIVEPAIAASIAFVGIENFWAPPLRRRVVTTFVLGLVHGFGFAGLLAELGLPQRALGVALASFNLGVEAGQAAVVSVVLPLLLWLGRREWWTRRMVPAASVGVALAGVYWLVERVA